MEENSKINRQKILKAQRELINNGDMEFRSEGKNKKVYYTEVELGDRLRDIRKDNKFTQAELAELLGITRSAVNSWEMGIALPSTQYLIRLAKIYKVSTDYLLGLDDSELIDISSLKQSDKEIIYSLLKRFKK